MTGEPAQFVIAIGSGKGGVGKSTVALNLALALADESTKVGLLDADLYGPDIPRMIGLAKTRWTESWTLARSRPQRFEPVERFGLRLASAGFILGEDQPMGLGASAIDLLLRQLLYEVEWGPLDYLVIDLPPGTADVLQSLVTRVRIAGAVVVVTPQDVAHLDARKAVQKFRHSRIPVLGGVENMSGFHCPHCGTEIRLFPEVAAARSIWSLDVEKLGSIPLDPAVGDAGDAGVPVLVRDPSSAPAARYREIAAKLAARLRS